MPVLFLWAVSAIVVVVVVVVVGGVGFFLVHMH